MDSSKSTDPFSKNLVCFYHCFNTLYFHISSHNSMCVRSINVERVFFLIAWKVFLIHLSYLKWYFTEFSTLFSSFEWIMYRKTVDCWKNWIFCDFFRFRLGRFSSRLRFYFRSNSKWNWTEWNFKLYLTEKNKRKSESWQKISKSD